MPRYRCGLLFRGDDHHHLAAFHAWVLFHHTHLLEIFLNPLQQLRAQFLVGHFTTAEAQGDLGLVPVFEEPNQVA